jgi:isochorismate pyruvate lyase
MNNDAAQPPEQCENMTQVRKGVDDTDALLINLLARRYAYMDAAARIKSDRTAVRDEARKAQVIGNVVSMAKNANLPSDDIGKIWDLLVESSIAYELREWDKNQG